ncbi:MAG: cache domain-containing protein [Sulfuritalea sp.]|nr:cache domain-containing protein [Sulfuritalea sp.]
MFLAVIGGGSYYYANAEIRHEVEQVKARDRELVQVTAEGLHHGLLDMAFDVDYLLHLPRLRESLSQPTPGNLARVAEYFVAYAEAHRNIDQIRWIDAKGKERVRVDYVANRGVVVPEASLQDKATRDYFIDTMALPAGSLYVSPFDLDIEHGNQEKSPKPVIRFASPIRDARHDRHGIVVVNFIGRQLLDRVRPSVGSVGARPQLLNRQGFWMVGPNPADEWGFDIDRPDARLGVRFPAAWAAIAAQAEGQVVLDSGLWSWKSIAVIDEIRKLVNAGNTPGFDVQGNANYSWHTVVTTPAARLRAIEQRIWLGMSPIIFFAILVAALVSYWIMRSQRHVEILNTQLADRAEAAGGGRASKGQLPRQHEPRDPHADERDSRARLPA